MTARILVALALLAGVAGAEAPAPATKQEAPHGHVGYGGGVSLGVAQERGRDGGWVARIDYELYPVLGEPGRVGPVFGFGTSLKMWKAGGDWGVGLPFALQLGVRTPHVRAVVDLGIEVLFVDQVDDDTGFGLYAPMAGVSVMAEAYGWHAGVGGRVTRRWQIGADDHTQLEGVLSIGRTFEGPMREPIR